MNAHTPFDAKQDWTNPYCQNSSNDPMVDALLGNAYHVVRTVYCNLGNLKLIYDFLNQYGMVLGVQSEAELKALTTEAKYARIYGFSRAGDRKVTDYLYVEGDRTGILPNDATATGSWITVATSGSSGGGGGTSSGESAYIPWVYNNGSATGGETSINVPDDTVGVPFIIINGDVQYVGRGFEFNVDNLSVTMAQPLEEGDEVVFLLTGTPAVPDNPNVNDWIQINWLYNKGAAVGGEQVIAIPYTFQSIPAVYKNGLRLYKGLTTESYTADPDIQRIFLTEPLATNDRLIVQIGGEAQVLEVVDHTLQEVARATNVKDSEVILSTDTTQFLNDKKIVYSVNEQKAYGLPVLPTNVYIQSVGNGKLIYSPGSIEVDLLPIPGSALALESKLTSNIGADSIGTTNGQTVQDFINSSHLNESDIQRYGYEYGSGLDAKSAILAAIAATGKAYLSGDITVSRFDWPAGAKLEGVSNITYTRRPTLPCKLDSYTPVDHSLMKGTYVWGVYDIWDMLQLKTAGFNTIVHYRYNFTDGGTIEKACNAAEAVGIRIIVNSPNDVPPSEDLALSNRDCVIGYYIFDEPQHQGVSLANQTLRVNAWRAATDRMLCIADNGVFGFANDTLYPDYDIVFVDNYYIASLSDSENKDNAITSWAEVQHKTNHTKIIPAVGLFTGDQLSNKAKNLAFSVGAFGFGDGSYVAFAWESSVSDPGQNDIISDPDFYKQAVAFNKVKFQQPYDVHAYAYGPSLGLNQLLRMYNPQYTSPDIKPFSVIQGSSAMDERHQVFGDVGLGIRNSGGLLALNLPASNYLVISLTFRNHADGTSGAVANVVTTTDDFFTLNTVLTKNLTITSGFTAGVNVNKELGYGIVLTPDVTTSDLYHKFVSGFVIASSWNNSTF